MILKDTAISTTINTMIGLLLLTGLLMIPSAVGAELNLNSISAQISLLQGLLTDYYVALTLNLENIIARLVAIASSIANISTQLTTQQNILFFVWLIWWSRKFNDYCIYVGDHGWSSIKTMKAALTNAEKEVQKLKDNAGHTGAGGQPQYSESQKIVHELYFANKPNETTTVI